MDHPRGLIETAEAEVETHACDCPDCGAPSASLSPVVTHLLGEVALRRCQRCGARHACERAPRRLLNCVDCGLPFLDEAPGHQRCEDCRNGEVGRDSEDAAFTAAAEAEVRAALAQRWSFVGSPQTALYLDRALGDLARHIEGAPAKPRVVLVQEPSLCTLALPSGVVLLSTGALGTIEDEAELAFVLGHELAHAASGDAARALVSLGLRDLALAQPEERGAAWAHAAEDLIRLGHGDRREHVADATALASMMSRGYDSSAAERYLDRVRTRAECGDPDLAQASLSHPLPRRRVQRLELIRDRLRVHPTGEIRVDREVFRRVAGHSVIASDLASVRPFADLAAGGRLSGSRLVWAVGVTLLIVILGLLYFVV
jgi:hypothetical protein